MTARDSQSAARALVKWIRIPVRTWRLLFTASTTVRLIAQVTLRTAALVNSAHLRLAQAQVLRITAISRVTAPTRMLMPTTSPQAMLCSLATPTSGLTILSPSALLLKLFF